jgi:hypothetical protein
LPVRIENQILDVDYCYYNLSKNYGIKFPTNPVCLIS